jgi:hypothetical protein
MRDVPQDYSAIVFADQGLAMDFSRAARPARPAKVKPTPPVRQSDLRRLQVQHVVERMRATHGRPAAFIWPEAA